MIAPRDDLPLVQFNDGEVTVFEHGWLVRSLKDAASKAGYPQWWLAEHVAESVTSYLRHRVEENVVALSRLSRAVQAVLQVIGYAEVAKHFDPGPPPIRISLLDLAREAGTGYELAFFELLGRTAQRMAAMRASHFEFFDTERCVKHLRAKKIWNRDCQALRAEIVEFLRDTLGKTGVKDVEAVAFSVV